jgi:thiamine-monophosphate kinase
VKQRFTHGAMKTGELALIERIRRRVKTSGVKEPELRLGIGDDCAILQPPAGHEVLVTTDFSLEARHFRRDRHPARSVGHRVLARGLSDLAAMGAEPLAAFLSLALPKDVAGDAVWVDGFLDGLLELAEACGVPLAGGDTSESPGDAVLADITLLGSAPIGTSLRRAGARAGDLLYCTGALGGAGAELESLMQKPAQFAEATVQEKHPHLFPQPRLGVGWLLRELGLASACIDMSDGLSTDLAHVCAASEVAAEVEWGKLPVSPLLRRSSPAARERAVLHGGEDYELLFTASADRRVPRRLAGVSLNCIGKIVVKKRGQPKVMLVDADGKRRPLEPAGWEHLR